MAEKIKNYSLEEILSMDKRFRASFINSLGGFKSVVLIGTQSKEGLTNLAVFNSIVHIGSTPPLIGFIVRPDSVERHTLENILSTKYYTLNHLHQAIVEQAHQTSARYDRSISEFDAVGLTPAYKTGFFAPFVKEAKIQLGMELKEKIELEINGTILIIGEIKQASLPSKVIQNDGFVNLAAAGTIASSGLDSYHLTEQLKRFSYAKPDSPLNEIK